MAWWNLLPNILKGGKDVAEVFTENKENRGQRQHEEWMADVDRDKAVLAQFAAEYHERQNRTWWDSLADGINRLVRPLITIAILSFFVLAPLKPETFVQIAKGYEIMPAGYWALLSVIIGFYFGGRMQLKAQDMVLKKDAVQAAKDLVTMRKEFRQLDDDQESVESKIFDSVAKAGKVLPKNQIILDWLKGKKAGE